MVEGVLVVNAAERVVFANHSFAEILEMAFRRNPETDWWNASARPN